MSQEKIDRLNSGYDLLENIKNNEVVPSDPVIDLLRNVERVLVLAAFPETPKGSLDHYILQVDAKLRQYGYRYNEDQGEYVLGGENIQSEAARKKLLLFKKIAQAEEAVGSLSEGNSRNLHLLLFLERHKITLQRSHTEQAIDSAERMIFSLMNRFDFAYDDTEGWVQISEV